MSHRHMVDRWLMVLTTKEASYIIVLGIVISILAISSTSATLEPLLIFRCTIWISSYNLTHPQHNSLSVQPHHIIRHCNTSRHFVIVLNYPATISLLPPGLPTSPPFHNTIPPIPPIAFRPFPVPWQYPPHRLEVLRELYPMDPAL